MPEVVFVVTNNDGKYLGNVGGDDIWSDELVRASLFDIKRAYELAELHSGTAVALYKSLHHWRQVCHPKLNETIPKTGDM